MIKILKAKEKRSDAGGYRRKSAVPKIRKEIIYPENDGKPMAENTLQFDWIVKIKENLEVMFENNPDVFIAGDLLWYPVEGDNKTAFAPDAMVVFGRPKGFRSSYRTWDEDNINPQVVFEVLSPSNYQPEMKKKLEFYERHGVEEYYEYDPYKVKLKGWIRSGSGLCVIEKIQGWTSPRLNICFKITVDDLIIFRPNGEPFFSTIEYNQLRNVAEKKAEAEKIRADAEKIRADAEKKSKEAEKIRADAEKKEKETEKIRANAEKKRADTERKRANAEKKAKEAEKKRADQLAAKLLELGIEM